MSKDVNEEENIADYLKRRASDVNNAIDKYLNDATSSRNLDAILGKSGYKYDSEAIRKSIVEPSNYLFKQGGKRLRPVLMLTIIDALGKDSDNYIEFSIIPEIIHTGTLIHDDMEDNSKVRRSGAAVHVKYGNDVALNLGDFMFYFPMLALLKSDKIDDSEKQKVLDIYISDMMKIGLGQATDLAWHNGQVNPAHITEEKYLQMVHSKTGVLLGMAAKFGGVFGGANDKAIESLGTFASTIGVAFQIQDDLLNIYPSGVSESKGGVGDDITEGKITLLVIHALQHSNDSDKKRLVEILSLHTGDKKLINEAINIIDKSGAKEYVQKKSAQLVQDAWNDVSKNIPESYAKNKLKQIAEFVIQRSI